MATMKNPTRFVGSDCRPKVHVGSYEVANGRSVQYMGKPKYPEILGRMFSVLLQDM